MKYVKKFERTTQFEDFKNSSEWITPNVCYIVETVKCNFQPYVKPPYQLTWPVELINGDNGEKGIALYNYLIENYTTTPDNYPYCFFEDILHLGIDKYITHYHTEQNMLYWVDAYYYSDYNGYISFPCYYTLHPGNRILNWYLYPDGRCDVYYD